MCPKRVRILFAVLLLLLHSSTLSLARYVGEHICRFDEMQQFNKDLPKVDLVQELPHTKKESGKAYTLSSETWSPIRIRTSSVDLSDETKYCKTVGDNHPDVEGKSMQCDKSNLLTEEKKGILERIIRSAIKLHSTRLKVKPISYGFKVPEFTNGFCSRFTVPDSHRQNGVKDADMVLYVSSFPTKRFHLHAAAAPCAVLHDGRPVVGAITFATMYILNKPYSVRVAAHEIAHALGFTYKLLEKNAGVKLTKKTSVRGKPSVNEVQGTATVAAVKTHFGCDRATGMELEDENGRLIVPTRSHWERRNAVEELMAPVVNKGYYTSLTLSLFSDMGFYQAALDNAESMEWGKEAGCDFLEKPCIEKGVSKFPKMFCGKSDGGSEGCTSDMRAQTLCPTTMTMMSEMAPYYQYYENTKEYGDFGLLTDRCPFIESTDTSFCSENEKWHGREKAGDSVLCIKANHTDQNGKRTSSLCAVVSVDAQGNVLVEHDNTSGQKHQCKNAPVTVTIDRKQYNLICPTAEKVRNAQKTRKPIRPPDSEDEDANEVNVIPLSNAPHFAATPTTPATASGMRPTETAAQATNSQNRPGVAPSSPGGAAEGGTTATDQQKEKGKGTVTDAYESIQNKTGDDGATAALATCTALLLVAVFFTFV